MLFPATIAGRFASNARLADKTTRPQAYHFARVIPEIDIWHAANLMVKRYGEKALEESAIRADELAAAHDDHGAATWRRITTAVRQVTNNTPPGLLH